MPHIGTGAMKLDPFCRWLHGYFVAMDNLLAGVIGALVGLAAVAVGAWLQGRKEHQRWLRDQKLRAAIDFIGATGDLYDHRRRPIPATSAAVRKFEEVYQPELAAGPVVFTDYLQIASNQNR
ncbi:MAG TPA: hypothetical protein VF933_03965 [Streptosporangiaceae bacterium]